MKRILIVDDDIKITSYLNDDLKSSFGFEVLWLVSADDVIKTLTGSKFDAMILDIMMPIPEEWSFDETRRSMDGLSTGLILLEKIRALFPKLPIVIYSAKKVTVTDKYVVTLNKPEISFEIVEQLNKLMSNAK